MKSVNLLKTIMIAFFLFCFAGPSYSQEDKQLAFPSAEGYGKYTKGGTGGRVVIVKSLGEFGSAVSSPGPKTIVFQVSGEVKSPGNIPSGTTIAGQTAPGDGICIRGGIGLSSNVILRYVRVRGPAGDNIGAKDKTNIILDHVTASWSTDESVSIYHCKYVTIQWCLIAESLGSSHNFAGIWGGPNNTYHHNLLAHHRSRVPRFSGGIANNDYRNNVVYNWERNTMYGGEAQQRGGGYEGYSYINVVANYYKYGPAAISEPVKCRIVDPWGSTGYGKYYVAENFVYGYPEVTADNWDGGEYGGVQVVGKDVTSGLPTIQNDRSMKADKPAPFMPINQDTPEVAYQKVLKHAGCSFPKRDELDAKIIEEVRTGTAARGKNGIVGGVGETGFGTLKSTTPPADSDEDGMPDEYETKMGLDPKNPKDATERGKGGFTNLVLYCESLVAPTFVVATKSLPQEKLELSHGYANHFNASPTIQYTLSQKSKVRLEIFNMAGRNVGKLVDEVKPAGAHSVSLKKLPLYPGLYVYKISAADQVMMGKMLLVNQP